MKWILIVFLFSNYGNQIKNIEFNTETACLAAAQLVHETLSQYNYASDKSVAYCVQKGMEPR